MNISRLIRSLILLAAVICSFGTSLAMGAALEPDSPTLRRILAAGELRVGSPGDYRPYTDHDLATDAWRGADIELARALAAHLGVGLVIVPTTWARLGDDAAADRFDVAVGGISVTPERKRRALFSVPYAHDGKTALVGCSRLAGFDELRELNQPATRIVVNPGGTNERFARERLSRAKLTVHADNLSVFDEVVAGRADAMITDAVEARLQATLRPGVLCAAHPDRPFDRSAKALLLPQDARFKRLVDVWLKRLLAEGAVDAARERWLAFPWQRTSVLSGLIDARLAVMSDVARNKWNSGAAIEDPVRERDLIADMIARGLALGVPAQRTEAFFVAQIKAARELQQDLFDLWRSQGRQKLPAAPDLQKTIRPQLDRISAAMVTALAEEPAVRDVDDSHAALSTQLLSPRAARTALAPLAAAGVR